MMERCRGRTSGAKEGRDPKTRRTSKGYIDKIARYIRYILKKNAKYNSILTSLFLGIFFLFPSRLAFSETGDARERRSKEKKGR